MGLVLAKGESFFIAMHANLRHCLLVKKLWHIPVYLLTICLVLATMRTAIINDAHYYEHLQEQTVMVNENGTGTVIERGNNVFVWTADHVVPTQNEIRVSKHIRVAGKKAGIVSFKARLLARDPARDLALFWVDVPKGYFRAAKISEKELLVGETLAHVGNVLVDNFDESVSIGILSQKNVQPTVADHPTWPWKFPTDQGTFSAFYGSSGGPVFNDDGKFVGVLVGGLVGKGYINFVPVREMKIFARKAGVLWAIQDGRSPRDELLEQLADRNVNILTFSVN